MDLRDTSNGRKLFRCFLWCCEGTFSSCSCRVVMLSAARHEMLSAPRRQLTNPPTQPLTHTHRVFDMTLGILPCGRINASAPPQGKLNTLLTAGTDCFESLLSFWGFGFVQTFNVNIECCLKEEVTLLNLCSEPVKCVTRTVWQEQLFGKWLLPPYKQGRGNQFVDRVRRGASSVWHWMASFRLLPNLQKTKNCCSEL